ncbi:MAG: hypothetical protein C4523_12165 [Myxococcales bacterium]|nr:MAG: hypothetical protein C4523_12165 [Myxococcales bacterium]
MVSRAFARLAAGLVAALVFCLSDPSQAAHPLRLTDYSPQSRIGLEAAYGRMKEPLPADLLHYLLEVDANIHAGLHLRLGLPFSGYSGAGGADNFIRGNLLVGASYDWPLADFFSLGFGLRLYLPTYERADPIDVGVPQDPRRAALAQWHYRFQYALEDGFPVVPELAARFRYAGFYTQLEGAFTWAPNVRESDEAARKANITLLQYGVGIGYDVLGYVEFGASFTGLVDPASSGANLGDALGLPVDRPRSLHAATVGVRGQYKWFAARFETTLPLDSRHWEMLAPTYIGALQTQFP